MQTKSTSNKKYHGSIIVLLVPDTTRRSDRIPSATLPFLPSHWSETRGISRLSVRLWVSPRTTGCSLCFRHIPSAEAAAFALALLLYLVV